MLFKNETKENIKYRIGSYLSGFEWYTVRPGETKDLPWMSGKNLPLTLVEEKTELVQDGIVAVFPEELEQSEKEFIDYKKYLVSIKGVGKKSAEDIIEKYPTIKELIKAIENNEEIHNYDNIDEAVKNSFEA